MKNANRSLIIFRKKDRKPAISSTTHSRVLDADDCDDRLRADSADTSSPDTKLISQEDLELWILRRRQFREEDEPIAVALSRGAKVQPGVHTAELLPVRNEDGSVHFKLMVR